MEEMQTRLHPPNSSTHFSYNRVPWKLKVSLEQEEINCHAWIFQIRKEVFSPSEQLTNPTTVHLVFCQASFSFWFFSLIRYIYCSMKLTDPQFRSSSTHSARCASAWLSLRERRWWATWTNTTSAPRTSTAHSTRTLQRWELKKKKILQHLISKSNVRWTSFPWQMTSQHTSVGFILLPATTKRYWYHCAWVALCYFYCGVSPTIKTPGWPPVVVDHCYNCYNFM